ncbi:MAG: preprotein translocase subunit YajC [Candidatus Competibacteraceae bacterium]
MIADAMAQAQGPAAGQPSMLGMLLPMLILFGAFYFFMIRPQQKRAKEHQQLIESLKKGDEVQIESGIIGRIIEVGEEFIRLEVADNVQLKVRKKFVSTPLLKGTVKGDL